MKTKMTIEEVETLLYETFAKIHESGVSVIALDGYDGIYLYGDIRRIPGEDFSFAKELYKEVSHLNAFSSLPGYLQSIDFSRKCSDCCETKEIYCKNCIVFNEVIGIE